MLISNILPLLEKKYDVTFSYIDILLKDKKVSLTITDTTSLLDLIKKLEKQTQLKFQKTGKGFITIRKFTSKDTLSVCGYVIGDNNEPLEKINIFFKALRFNVDTDENGYFKSDSIPYDSPILLSAPGFRQKVINSSDFLADTCKTVSLTRMVEELEEVVIQNYTTKGITKNHGDIHINLEEMAILPGLTEPDILQSIQLTPGVNSPYETAAGLYVRGGIPNQNLVLWNGIKMYHHGHFFGLISAFNPYVAKEVKFSKSGVRSSYGDRIGSVVDIKTPNTVADRISGGAGVTLLNADAVLHVPLLKDKVSVQVSGRRSLSDIVKTPTYSQMAKRVFQHTKIADPTSLSQSQTNFYYEDYNANLIMDLTKYDKIEMNGVYSNNMLNYKASGNTSHFNDKLRTENEGYNIKWTHSYSEQFSQQIQGYYTGYLLNYEYITNKSGFFVQNESKKNTVKDIGAGTTLTYNFSDTDQFLGGYQYANNSIRYAFVTTAPSYELILSQDDRSLGTHSVFTEYLKELPKDFYLATGIRFNYYTELDKSFVEPRLFFQKYLSNKITLNITGEYRSQSATKIRESVVSDLALENQVWTLSNNKEFPIITSYQFSLGSTFRQRTWLVDMDTYYKQIDNITSLTAGFINPVDNTYHLGESRVYGLDLFIKKKFRHYKSWISYSYINTRNKFDNLNDNQFFPGNWNIEHTIKWSHFYTLGNLQLSLGWFWHSGKSYTNISSVDSNDELIVLQFGDLNAETLPVYHRLDLSAMYDIHPRKNATLRYRIGVSVFNLYDQKNILNREFRTTNTLNNSLLNADIYGLGITPNLNFRVFW